MAPSTRAASPTKKKFKRNAGDSLLKKKRRVVTGKSKSSTWFPFTRRPWFKSIKDFLVADSFAYGPLIDREVNSFNYTFADIGEVLKKTLVRRPTKVLKETFVSTPRVLKEAFISRQGTEPKPVEILEESEPESDSEENNSGIGGRGQVVNVLNHAGGGYMVQNESGQLVSSITTIQKKVVTTTTYANENELGELKSGLAATPPRSPMKEPTVDTTRDTDLTDPVELEDDEQQSHAGDAQVPLDFETAEMVAGKLIEKIGGRFSKDLGIHVDTGDDEVERWFLASNLFSRSLPFNVSKQTYKELMALGVFKVTDFMKVEEAKVAELFERTGYTKYGQRVTAHFRKLASQLQDEMSGQVTSLKHTADPVELIRRLRALNGVKLSAVHSFMRELRGVWRACDPNFDNRTKKAAVHLKLLSSMKPASDPEDILLTFALEAGIDGRDLEVAFFKFGAEHEKDYAGCKGGPWCEVLSSHDRYLSSLP